MRWGYLSHCISFGRADRRRLAQVASGDLFFSHLPLLPKKLRKQLPALVCKDPGNNFAAMVEAGVAEKLVKRLNGAGLRVGSAIHNQGNSGLKDRTRTHRARLQRDVYHTIAKSPVVPRRSGLSDCKHFRVGSRIPQLLPLVEGRCNHSFAVHDNGADRDLTGLLGSRRLLQGKLHPSDMRFQLHGYLLPINERTKNARKQQSIAGVLSLARWMLAVLIITRRVG